MSIFSPRQPGNSLLSKVGFHERLQRCFLLRNVNKPESHDVDAQDKTWTLVRFLTFERSDWMLDQMTDRMSDWMLGRMSDWMLDRME